MDRSMEPYRGRVETLRELAERVAAFRGRPFPTEWAKEVSGVGLASLAMRAERVFAGVWQLGFFCEWNRSYLASRGEPGATATRLQGELRGLLGEFERFLDVLPAEPREYFEGLRALVADAEALAKRWRLAEDVAGSGDGG